MIFDRRKIEILFFLDFVDSFFFLDIMYLIWLPTSFGVKASHTQHKIDV